MRTVEAHVDINHYSTCQKEFGKPLKGEACVRAIANINYSIRGANGAESIEVGVPMFGMTVTGTMKMRIGLDVNRSQKRVMEKWIVTFPNEASEDQCRYIAKTFLEEFIVDSEALGRCDFHFKPGNYHGHMHLIDGLETLASAKARAAERDAERTDGKKTRVRRRNQLRFKELYFREPRTLSPDDPGVKMKSHLKKKWADHVNACCLKFGINVHFEHRSRKERGLPGKGTIHLGPQNHAMMTKLHNAEIHEMCTGVISDINPRLIDAAERAMCMIDKNREILAERERIQKEWSSSEKITTEWINDARRNISVTTEHVNENNQHYKTKAENSEEVIIQMDLFDENREHNVSENVLEAFGIDAKPKSNGSKAAHVPSVFENIEIQKKAQQVIRPLKGKNRVDHKKGFYDAIHLLGKSLIKRDRRNARKALLRASYHCSGAYGITEIHDKKNFIRNRLAAPVKDLLDKFVARLRKSTRERIYRAKPR
ncbi:MobA/MobL family protein [Magnetovibrio sp. PR-2]|uniref:MobA/MobL family protein n=1 Tax=Magnetovibrio sp. PR-2 TaxID=3120356 RepID=UPI002FCE06AB